MKEDNKKITDTSGGALALEIFSEIKIQSKRWCIAFFTVLILWFITVGGFIWYVHQYDYITYSQDGGGYNNINTGEQGDVTNGAEVTNTEAQRQ